MVKTYHLNEKTVTHNCSEKPIPFKWIILVLWKKINKTQLPKQTYYFKDRPYDIGQSDIRLLICQAHDNVNKWKHFPRYWPFVREIHQSPVNSPQKSKRRGALTFPLICELTLVRLMIWDAIALVMTSL